MGKKKNKKKELRTISISDGLFTIEGDEYDMEKYGEGIVDNNNNIIDVPFDTIDTADVEAVQPKNSMIEITSNEEVLSTAINFFKMAHDNDKEYEDSISNDEMSTILSDAMATDTNVVIPELKDGQFIFSDDGVGRDIKATIAYYKFKSISIAADICGLEPDAFVNIVKKEPCIWEYEDICFSEMQWFKDWSKRYKDSDIIFKGRFVAMFLVELSKNIENLYQLHWSNISDIRASDELAASMISIFNEITRFINGLRVGNKNSYTFMDVSGIFISNKRFNGVETIGVRSLWDDGSTKLAAVQKIFQLALTGIVDGASGNSIYLPNLSTSSISNALSQLGTIIKYSDINKLYKIYNSCNPVVNTLFDIPNDDGSFVHGIRAISFINFIFGHNATIENIVNELVFYNKECISERKTKFFNPVNKGA